MALAMALCGFAATAKPIIFEQWRVEEQFDKQTNESIKYAYVRAVKDEKYEDTYFHIECKKGKVRPSFTHADFVSKSNSYVTMRLWVDDNEPQRFLSKIYANTNKSGFIPIIAKNSAAAIDQSKKIESLYQQMLEGEQLTMEVNHGTSKANQSTMPIAGFNDAYSRVKHTCDGSSPN